MIVSVHTARVGLPRGLRLLRRPIPPGTPGLRYAEAGVPTPLGARVPRPDPRRPFVIASWNGDDDLDRFLASPAAGPLAGGWHARLEPRRVYGAWPDMPGLPEEELPMDPGEPAAVLTLGRPRPRRFVPFLRTSAPAERLAASHPGLFRGVAMVRLPRFVATFSLWRRVDEMRDYALGRPDKSHLNAIRADRKEPFHHQEAFVRFRPYAAEGDWDDLTALGDLRQAPVQPLA